MSVLVARLEEGFDGWDQTGSICWRIRQRGQGCHCQISHIQAGEVLKSAGALIPEHQLDRVPVGRCAGEGEVTSMLMLNQPAFDVLQFGLKWGGVGGELSDGKVMLGEALDALLISSHLAKVRASTKARKMLM